MWHGHTVDRKLRDVRGRLVLWKRFTSANPLDDTNFPGVDFTELNSTLNNTKGTILKAGGVSIAWVQDFYEDASLKEKIERWISTADRASVIGGSDDWHFRSGIGVIPMDFPDTDLIDAILALNFSQSYCLTSFPWGKSFAASLADEAASKEK